MNFFLFAYPEVLKKYGDASPFGVTYIPGSSSPTLPFLPPPAVSPSILLGDAVETESVF